MSCPVSLQMKRTIREGSVTVLTAEIWHLLELLLPILGELDRLPHARLARRRHPLLVGVGQILGEEVGMDGIEDVEEVLPRRTLAIWEDVREVLLHLLIIGELRPEVLDGQLVVVGHLDADDLLLLEQLLLAGEHLLQEVLVDRGGRRQVELYCNGVRNG